MNQLEENHSDGLSIFEPPPLNTAIQSKIWIQFPPSNQITECGVIEFVIPPQTAGYMDLKNSSLKVKLRITDSFGKPITDDANVGLACLPLQSIFSQIDCTLQQTPVGQVGRNYPYKAYIDTLLSTRESEKVLRESQLFIKDNPGVDDPDVKSGMNTGLYMRSMYTNKGQIVEMEGPIHIDIFQQNRLLINGVGLALRLWPSKDAFRLISNEDDASYKVQILDVSFNLCLQKPNAGVLIAHTNLIKDSPAIYPYMNSNISVSSISKGQNAHSENHLFQGEISFQLIVTLLESASFGGVYKKNPFFF